MTTCPDGHYGVGRGTMISESYDFVKIRVLCCSDHDVLIEDNTYLLSIHLLDSLWRGIGNNVVFFLYQICMSSSHLEFRIDSFISGLLIVFVHHI